MTRRREVPDGLDALTPEQELEARLTGRPADVAAALAEVDASAGRLHAMMVRGAMHAATDAERYGPAFRETALRRLEQARAMRGTPGAPRREPPAALRPWSPEG